MKKSGRKFSSEEKVEGGIDYLDFFLFFSKK